jgi:hypothetical protein
LPMCTDFRRRSSACGEAAADTTAASEATGPKDPVYVSMSYTRRAGWFPHLSRQTGSSHVSASQLRVDGFASEAAFI